MCRCHRPACKRRCVKTFTEQYKLYENCCYSLYKVCSCCGHEFDYRRHSMCPNCGAQMGDPPGDPPRGGFGGFGGFGRFGRGGFGRFGGFRRDGFGRFRDFDRFGGFGFPFAFLPFDFDDEEF